jgi:hypothetical protein
VSRRTHLALAAAAALLAVIRRRMVLLARPSRRRASLTALALAVVMLPAAPARAAEPVLDWNARAVTALLEAGATPLPNLGQDPKVQALHMAMTQGAVYDAVNSIDKTYEPYLQNLPPAPATASKEAAVATAAHHVLTGLAPELPVATRNRLEIDYANELAAIADGDAKSAGIAAGAAAATAMLDARVGDGRYGSFTFSVGTGLGEWVPTSGIIDPSAWVARVRPFVLESQSQFRTDGPQLLASAAYAQDYNEVKRLGRLNSPDRTERQTTIALFHSSNPIELWNRTLRDITTGDGTVEQARLFAMATMAGADSIINTWDDKAFWSFWRPITAIHRGEEDGNDATIGDPTWTPQIVTPPYPEHPSGYTAVTAGMLFAAAEALGTKRVDFTVQRPGVAARLQYRRLDEAVRDVVDARVWLGIHFRTADVQSMVLGRKVVHWLSKHYFREAA